MRYTLAAALGLSAVALLVCLPLSADAHPAPAPHAHFDPHPRPLPHYDYRPYWRGRHEIVIHRPWVVAGPPVVVAVPAADAEYGLRVTALDAAGPAAAAGLQVGDIILTVGGERVQTLDELRTATGSAAAEEVVYIRASTGVTEAATVAPRGGLLGVRIEQVSVLPSGDA